MLGHRGKLVQTFIILAQLGDDKGVVVVPVEQFVLRKLRLLGGSVVVVVEDGAVDALGLVFLGNQPLIAVDDLVKFSRLLLRDAGVRGIRPGIVHIHGSDLHLNDLVRPFGVPALRSHLILDLLSGHQDTPEAIRSLLGVRRIGREENVPIRGQSSYLGAVNRLANHRELGRTLFPQLLQSLLRPLIG